MSTGYKVVSYDYTSAIAQGKYRMTYEPGTTVEAPPNTLGLMFFDTLYNARLFNTDFGLVYKILEVEFDQRDLLLHCRVSRSALVPALDWFYITRNFPNTLTIAPPKGTLFAKRLTVTHNER